MGERPMRCACGFVAALENHHADCAWAAQTRALKRCKEERDELETRLRHERNYVGAAKRTAEAEAKCERLEAAITEHKRKTAKIRRSDVALYAALSTPKTEGELYGLPVYADDRLEPGEWLLGADPIGRDVRGYEK